MILLAALALLLLTVPLAGGHLTRLRDPGLRRTWLLYSALGVQLLITVVVSDALPPTAGRSLHLVSYALAFTWVVANRHVAGLGVVALGGALNLAAIVANGGQMPASPEAMARAGLSDTATHFVNSGVTEHPRLLPLGDVFAVPADWPLANVFSLGDVVLVLGALVTIHHLAGSRWVAGRRSGAADTVDDPTRVVEVVHALVDGVADVVEDIALAPRAPGGALAAVAPVGEHDDEA